MILLAGIYAVEVARILRSSASYEAGGHEEKRAASLAWLSRSIGFDQVRDRNHEQKRAASQARLNRRVGRGPS